MTALPPEARPENAEGPAKPGTVALRKRLPSLDELAPVGLELLGRGLAIIGVLVLLFSAFQLWGTGFAESEAQRELAARLEEAAVIAAPDPSEPVHKATPSAENQVPAVLVVDVGSPPPAGDRPETPAASPLAYQPPTPFEEGDPVASLLIPAIELEKTVVYGTGRESLRTGPGLYPSTVRPGWPGNSAIAGHRTTYGAPFFRIDELVPGDEIIVESSDGRFTYEVMPQGDDQDAPVGHKIVTPEAVEVLGDYGDDRLTLTACHPLYSAKERIVVTAELVGQPYSPPSPPTPEPIAVAAPAVAQTGGPSTPTADVSEPGYPEPDATVPSPAPHSLASEPIDDGGWQFGYLGATLLWAAITLGIVLAAWLIARFWQPWPTYAVAVPPVAMALFSCFVQLDRLLPAS